MKDKLIILISIIIDGIIPNITLFNFNNITYFTPICTGVSLVFLYKENKKFYLLLLYTIIVYAGLYINNLLLSGIVFFSIALMLKIFKKFFRDNMFTVVIQILLVIFLWDLIMFIFQSLFVVNSFLWGNYFYKITHSILFNIIYGIILFKICNKCSKINALE